MKHLLKLFNVVILTVIFSFAIIAMNNTTPANSCPRPDTYQKCKQELCWDLTPGSIPEAGCCVYSETCLPLDPACPTGYCW